MSENDQSEAQTPRYAKSPVTGTWYRVDAYEDLGDGKIVAESKTEVDVEDVPEDVRRATEERMGDCDV